MPTVKLAFTHKNSFLDTAIRFFSGRKSKVSHVAFIVDDPAMSKNGMVYEAGWRGFVAVPWDKWRGRYEYVIIPALAEPLDEAFPLIVGWLGNSYDYSGLFGMVWVRVGRWFHRRFRNPFRSRNSLFCSEAAVRAMQAVNYPEAKSMDPETITPED